MFTARNAQFQRIARMSGLEMTDEIELFAEILAEECADIAENTWEVNLPAAPVIRRHFNLIEPKK